MARIRTIKPKFYDDLKVGRLSRDARYLYIALWVFADDLGVVNGDSIWIKSKVFPYDQIQLKQFDGWIDELVRHGFIRLLSHDGERFVYLPNFTRHQVINRPNYEDLNMPKDLLDKLLHSITEQSVINHGTITEQSVPYKEGDKEEENKKNTPIGVEEKTPAPQTRYEKFMQWMQKNTPSVLKLRNGITEQQFERIMGKYSTDEACNVLLSMENYKDLTKKYTSAYLTFTKWARKDYGDRMT